MQTESSSALEQPIIPLAIIKSIISTFPGLYDGTYPIRDPNAPRHTSHARRRSAGHITRPENPFIIFRTFFTRNKDVLTIENKHQNLSKIAGKVWKYMTKEERRPWYKEAKVVEEEHRQAHPTYVYRPSPVLPRSEKRKVRKGCSEEEKQATEKRCHLVATQIRQAMPGASKTVDGNDSDGISDISRESGCSSRSSSSSTPTSSTTGVSSNSSVPNQGAIPTIIETANTLPSKRNAGVQRTTGWLANLIQQASLVPASSSPSVFTRSGAAGTINPANLRLANPVDKPSAANIWGLRDGSLSSSNGFFIQPTPTPTSTSSSSFKSPVAFGINTSSSSSFSAFGHSSWNTSIRTRSSFHTTSLAPGLSNAKGKARQASYADSDDELDANEDGMDEDSDHDY